jgi:hypothetical protein
MSAHPNKRKWSKMVTGIPDSFHPMHAIPNDQLSQVICPENSNGQRRLKIANPEGAAAFRLLKSCAESYRALGPDTPGT